MTEEERAATIARFERKAKLELGWEPEITVGGMCAEMVAYDLDVARSNSLLKSHGHDVRLSME